MTILSARVGNPDGTAILLETAERGEVLLSLDGPSELADEYSAWLTSGKLPAPYAPPVFPAENINQDQL